MEILSGKLIEKDLKDSELAQVLKSLKSSLSQKENTFNLSQSALSDYKQLISNLLKFTSRPDEELQLLISCCLFEVLRIVAPLEIFTKKQVKSLFEAACRATFFLQYPSHPNYTILLHLLEIILSIFAVSLAIKYKLYTILVKFIENCLEFISNNCEISTEMLILGIIRVIFDEIPEISDNFLVPVLISLKKEFKKTPRYRISANLLVTKVSKIRNAFANFIESAFLQTKPKNSNSGVFNDKHEIVCKLYKINYEYHEYLFNLFSSLPEMLKSKKNDKLIKMVGKIAACKKSTLASAHSHLFSEFLKLFESDQEDVKNFMFEFTCKFFKNHRNAKNTCEEILEYVTVRLKDANERIRAQALQVLQSVSIYTEFSKKTISEICERAKDVKKKVRKTALKSMFTLYQSKRLSKHIRNSTYPPYYKKLIESIFQFIKSFGDTEEQTAAINSLENLIVENFQIEDQAATTLAIFEDLSADSRKIFEDLLKNKSVWAKYLQDLIENPDADSLSIFCGNMKLSIFNHKLKSSLRLNTGELFDVLNNEDNRKTIKNILESQSYEEKSKLIKAFIETIKDSKSVYLQLSSRCFNLIICQEHIPYYINNLEILPMLSKSFPKLIDPYLSDIVCQVDQSAHNTEILLTLSVFDIKKYAWEEKIHEKILDLCQAGPLTEAESGRKLIKHLKLSFISQLVNKLTKPLPTEDLIKIQLLFLKQIVKYWPTVTENFRLDIKNLACFICENSELHIETKSLSIILLHSLIKYCGFYRQAIFAYIRKIGFNLESFYKKKIKKDSELTSNEEFTLRARCFKSLLGILNTSEMKSMLNCKTLTCFAYAALSPVYSNTICDLIQNNIFYKSNIPPPLLSILALQLAGSESRTVKDALVQVFQKMKQNSVERNENGGSARVQPEIYFPYVLYIISKCRVSEKSYKVILLNYVKCLFTCEEVDVNYLMFLLKQLKKFTIEGKNVKSDVWTAPSKHLELDKLCDEVILILVQNYLPEMYQETQCKVLIPSTFFVKKGGLTSPDQVKYRLDEKGSENRKRANDSTPGKVYNMFNSP